VIQSVGSGEHHPTTGRIAQTQLGVVTRRSDIDRKDVLPLADRALRWQDGLLHRRCAVGVKTPQTQYGHWLGGPASETGRRKGDVAARELPEGAQCVVPGACEYEMRPSLS
jgi:hypothetical protein